MIHLRSVQLKSHAALPETFPFDLPIIRLFDEIQFESPVTFFVGENGTGKSTLLEGIAAGTNAVAVSSQEVARDKTLIPARKLAEKLKFVFNNRPRHGFFFRAEDIFGFTKKVIDTSDELKQMEDEFDKNLTGYGRALAVGAARGQRMALAEKYGADPDAKSHGESFLDLFETRIRPGGFYLLDEPETPLSPLRQLTFISILKEMVALECQFIIATHSPILMAFPEATILDFGQTPLKKVEYDSVEHVALTRDFLNNPETFLRRL